MDAVSAEFQQLSTILGGDQNTAELQKPTQLTTTPYSTLQEH
jgi:hypothetical protein